VKLIFSTEAEQDAEAIDNAHAAPSLSDQRGIAGGCGWVAREAAGVAQGARTFVLLLRRELPMLAGRGGAIECKCLKYNRGTGHVM
jgi:hypothetical protein